MIKIRRGGPDDFDAMMRFFDGAVEWLSRRGSAGQWGTEPWSGNPVRVEQVRAMAANRELYFADVDGEPAGGIILDPAPPEHVTAADEPEIYIGWLITSREHTGKGVGGRLIRFALEEAGRRGIGLVRVDCWAGGDGHLVRYYEGQGFKPTFQFDRQGWIGQVFEQRLP